MIIAGVPAITTPPSSKLFVTTEPEPTIVFFPSLTPGYYYCIHTNPTIVSDINIFTFFMIFKFSSHDFAVIIPTFGAM